jgi:hypothetical protein
MSVVEYFLHVALLMIMAGAFCVVVGAEKYSARFFKFAGLLAVAYALVKMFVPH